MRLPLLVALLLILIRPAAQAVDLKNRTTSSSGQFVVYCDDRLLRSRVASFAEEVKSSTLRILQMTDHWSLPIIITMDAAKPGTEPPPVVVRMVNTPAGAKIDIIVLVGDDPARVAIQRHIVRAILLEITYRDRPPLKPNQPQVEAPWWLVYGLVESIRRRDDGANVDIFKSIVRTDKLPSLESLLPRVPITLETSLGIVDRACALCLVEALLSLPNGAENLKRFISRWPESKSDPKAALIRHFPELAIRPEALSKWWSLQIARFAKSKQWKGISIAESSVELDEALILPIVMDKNGRIEKFVLHEFSQFIKLPAAPAALQEARIKIVNLNNRANPLFRPILAEYEKILSRLIARKTKGIAQQIKEIETYRTTLIERMEQITDYLNWYEATQPEANAHLFDRYLKDRARQEKEAKKLPDVDPRIKEYLDSLEKEFTPTHPSQKAPDSAKK